MRRHDLIAIITVFAAVTLWFGDVLFTGETYFLKDLFRYHYAQKQIVRDAMLSGELPLWSPAYGAGQPLAANPAYELFYPPQWLILLPSFRLGFTLHIVVHAYLCALGLYLLLRSMALSPIAAAFGSLAFVLGGPLLSLIRVLPFLFSVTWMPFIFLFARRHFLTRSRRDFLFAALFLGLQALIAEPTTMLQTWLLIAAYGAYRACHGGSLGRNALAIVLLVLCGFVIAAAQILPTIDFARDSVRSRPIPFDVVSALSLSPSRPLEVLFPSLVTSGDPFLASIYLGVPMGILFLAGIATWKRGTGLVVSICAVAYVLAIGVHTPLLQFLYDLGVFESIRYPSKFAIGALFAIVVWGAMTLQRLIDGDAGVLRWAIYITLGWLAAAFLLVMAGSVTSWAVVFVRGLAVLAVLWVARRQSAPVWGATLVAITLVDVHPLQDQLNPTMPRRFFEQPAVAQQLDAARKNEYRIFHSAEWDWAYVSPQAEAYFASHYGPWWFIRNGMMPRTPPAWGWRMAIDQDYDETSLLPTADFVRSMRDLRVSNTPRWQEPLMAMSNAWYSTRFRAFAAEERRAGNDPEKMMPVEFVPAAEQVPRYYFAEHVEPIASREEFVAKLRARTWTPRVAFVASDAFRPMPGTVHAVRETLRTIRIDAEATGRALLVLSVTPHKYWRATIDGTPAPLRLANIGYQAIEVPPGRHTIALTYSNPLVLAGLAISVLPVVALGVGIAVSPSVPLPPEVEEKVGKKRKKR